MLVENQINYLVIILCIVLIILIISYKNIIEPNQILGTLIILSIIVISTVYTLCFNKEEFTNRNCFNRNKEYLDSKEKMYDRIKELAHIEEQNRTSLVYDNEMEKVIEMGNHNLDYSANGETF